MSDFYIFHLFTEFYQKIEFIVQRKKSETQTHNGSGVSSRTGTYLFNALWSQVYWLQRKTRPELNFRLKKTEGWVNKINDCFNATAALCSKKHNWMCKCLFFFPWISTFKAKYNKEKSIYEKEQDEVQQKREK